MKELIHVLLVSDQTVERKGLSSLLNTQPSLVVVGEAADGQEAVLMTRNTNPEIALLDQRLLCEAEPGLIWRIWQENAAVTILVMCNFEKFTPLITGFYSSDVYFMQRDATLEELTRAIHEVIRR